MLAYSSLTTNKVLLTGLIFNITPLHIVKQTFKTYATKYDTQNLSVTITVVTCLLLILLRLLVDTVYKRHMFILPVHIYSIDIMRSFIQL